MSTRPSVWIIGSSLVVRLERWLRRTRGSDYDFDIEGDVEWFGQSGMTWQGAISRLRRNLDLPRRPSIIIIHAAANNIGSVTGIRLALMVIRDLEWVLTAYPDSHVMFSMLLPRRSYRNQRNNSPRGLNRAARLVNIRIARFLARRGHSVIHHRGIRLDAMHDVLGDDGVHLSDWGNELFHLGFRNAMLNMLR